MPLSKYKLFSILLFLQVGINVLFIFDINHFLIRTLLSLLFLTFVPGILLLQIFRLEKCQYYEYLSYAVAASIAFLIITGLLINTVLPLMGIAQPLSLIPLGLSLNFSILLMTLIAFFRSSEFSPKVKIGKFSFTDYTILLITFTFPILSIVGSLTLNNGGSNIYSEILIICIALFLLLVGLFRNRVNENIYPIVLFLIATSLLLSYSLRSWHVFGWDINQEFQVFQLTKQNFLWAVSNSKSIYNSCLSVTILPTIFSSFLQINEEYVYKLVYQLLFALVPVNIYLITRRYANSLLAFFSSVLFMIQQTYYMEMTATVRQEIAFVFFTASILIIFNKNLGVIKKNILFLLFGIAMTLSHYSTTYIALILYLSTYGFCLIIKLVSKIAKKNNASVPFSYNLKLTSILILLVTTLVWNISVTRSYSNITNTARTIAGNIGSIFTFNDKSSTITSFLFNKSDDYTNEQLNNYIERYSSNYIKRFNVVTINNEEIRNIDNLKFVDIYPSQNNKTIERIILLPYTVSKYIILLGLILGMVYCIIQKLKNNKAPDTEYILMSMASLALLVAMVVIPHISVAYNIERLFQQGLIFTSLIIIFGILLIFKKISSLKIYFLALFITIYYIFQSGITAPFTGNVSRVNTFNEGVEFYAHYTHEKDVKAIKWLSVNNNHAHIFTDLLSEPKFRAFAPNNTRIIPAILPNIIDNLGYVYAGHTNNNRKIASIEDDINNSSSYLFIDYPFQFLNENKNLIYNNGGAKIYK